MSVIDGAQSAGAIPVRLDDLGVDAYAVPGQKWLLGPEGMGALWVRRGLADSLVPATSGYIAYSKWVHGEGGLLHPGARRFEATGFHRPSRDRAGAERRLAVDVHRAAVGGRPRAGASPPTRTPGSPRSPASRWSRRPNHGGTLVTFRIAGWPAAAAVAELSPRVFAIIRDLPPIDAIRISVGFWNSEEELERFAGGVELLAAHTPETIPPRKTLLVLGSDGRPLD